MKRDKRVEALRRNPREVRFDDLRAALAALDEVRRAQAELAQEEDGGAD